MIPFILKCPEKANLQSQKVGQCWAGMQGGRDAEREEMGSAANEISLAEDKMF